MKRPAIWVACAAALLAAPIPAQDNTRPTVSVVLEKADAGTWRTVDPRLVFRPDDEVRFRFRSSFSGYLYVLNQASTGESLWLFPTEQTGTENRVEANRWYLIPAKGGSFLIPKKPGFDTVFWIVSPTALKDLAAGVASGKPLNTLTPRCDPAELQSRGLCMDHSAGPHAVEKPHRLPPALSRGGSLQARDLVFDRNGDGSVVTISGPEGRTLVYEFWIAHH